MSLAWYRKWRPSSFVDVIGQDDIVAMLRQALKTDAVAHALLFCGPRGVGKTTVARLLAKSLNCQNLGAKPVDPCGKCEPCLAFQNDSMLDCIEIDAASTRGIDDIRALRDTIHSAPIIGQKKIYIIDEVHMLTKEAFNALLKTIEEPPSHVMLILATTEVAKVPSTILSRCQRFDFRQISSSVLAKQLQKIAIAEGVQIDLTVAELIADAAYGSGRDAVSLLQTVSLLGEKLSASNVALALGLVADEDLHKLFQALRSDANSAIVIIQDLLERGMGAEQIVRGVLKELRETLLSKRIWAEGLEMGQIIDVVDEWSFSLRQLKAHPEPLTVMAVAAYATAQSWSGQQTRKIVADVINTTPLPEVRVVEQADTSEVDVRHSLVKKDWHPTESEQKIWQSLIEAVKPHNQGLASLLGDAVLLGVEDGDSIKLTIGVIFPFHKDRIMTLKNRDVILDEAKKIMRKNCLLECALVNRSDTEKKISNTDVIDNESLDIESDNNLIQMAEQVFS